MPFDIKDSTGKVVATFENQPSQQDLEDLDTHLSGATHAPTTSRQTAIGKIPSKVTPQSMASDYLGGMNKVADKLIPSDLPTAAATGAGLAVSPLGPGASIPAYMITKQAGRMISDALSGKNTSSPKTTLTEDLPQAATVSMGNKSINDVKQAVKDPILDFFIGKKPEKLVQNLARPSTSLSPEEVNKITSDMLKYKALPGTERGWKNVNNQIANEGGNLESVLSEYSNKSMPRADLESTLQNQIANMKAAGAQPGEIASVQAKIDELPERWPEQIPMGTAQLSKQRIYKQNEHYFGMNPDDVGVQAEKELGETFRTGIEKTTGDPRVSEINSKLSDLLHMRSSVGRATNRLDNNNPISLGGQVALSTRSIPGKMGMIINNPTVKSTTAQALYNLRNKLEAPNVSGDKVDAFLKQLLGMEAK
jgi:hypothetical protein